MWCMSIKGYRLVLSLLNLLVQSTNTDDAASAQGASMTTPVNLGNGDELDAL